MQASDHLHTLIQSLTASEKRYFTIQTSKEDKNNIGVLLFKAMSEWKEEKYIEDEFIEAHKDQSFIRNFAYEKNYLYEQILKIMRSFHTSRTVEIQLNEMNIDIRFLYDKGLPALAHKQINKAISLAKKHQFCNEELVINKYKQILIVDSLINIDLEDYKRNITETVKQVSQRISLYLTRMDVMQLLVKPDWRNHEADIKVIINDLELKLETLSLSTYEKEVILNTLQFYYNKINDFQKLYDVSLASLSLKEKMQDKSFYKSKKLLMAYRNLLHAIFMLEKYEDYEEIIEKVKKIPIRTELDKANLFILYLQNEFLYHLNTKNYSNNDQLAQELQIGLKKHRKLIAKRTYVNFMFNLSLLYFFNHEYKKTQIHLSNLYNLISRDIKFSYINTLSRTLEVMCMFSENDWSIIDHSLRSWKRLIDGETRKEEIFSSIYELFQTIKKETFSGSDIDKQLQNIIDIECSVQWSQLKSILGDWIQASRKRKLTSNVKQL